jgi:hypothetical protein
MPEYMFNTMYYLEVFRKKSEYFWDWVEQWNLQIFDTKKILGNTSKKLLLAVWFISKRTKLDFFCKKDSRNTKLLFGQKWKKNFKFDNRHCG